MDGLKIRGAGRVNFILCFTLEAVGALASKRNGGNALARSFATGGVEKEKVKGTIFDSLACCVCSLELEPLNVKGAGLLELPFSPGEVEAPKMNGAGDGALAFSFPALKLKA